jgi:hypothetical protein
MLAYLDFWDYLTFATLAILVVAGVMVAIILPKVLMPRQMQGSFDSRDTRSGVAPKSGANSMSSWMKSTKLPTNSKMSTTRPPEHVPSFADSSTISRNMKGARATNPEP